MDVTRKKNKSILHTTHTDTTKVDAQTSTPELAVLGNFNVVSTKAADSIDLYLHTVCFH